MRSGWIIDKVAKLPKAKDAILIEGLPGIGNVGKVVVDFLVEEWDAKKLCSFSSHAMPHSVFVNEENLIELPSIALYHKKIKDKDVFLLAGDVQPSDEESSYQFCEEVLNLCKDCNVKEIVTLGGIGLQNIPKNPKVYCTGNDKKVVSDYKKKTDVDDHLYGVVGPIIGVSGLLLGLAKKRNLPAGALLAETFGHPMYLGVKGSKEILKVLEQRFELKIDIKELDKEIKELESEVKKRTGELAKQGSLQKVSSQLGEQNYIG